MSKIFISYRRQDSQLMAERIYQELSQHFPVIFYDLTTISIGSDFVDTIQQGIYDADVVLVLIGDRWVDTLHERREQEDFVRIEVETAMEQRKRIIPVLIEGASMPTAEDLPERIGSAFIRLNAQHMHIVQPYFGVDMNKLIDTLNNWQSLPPPAPLPSQKPVVPIIDTSKRWQQFTVIMTMLAVVLAIVAAIGFGTREPTIEIPVTQIVTQIVKETVEVPVAEIIKETVEVPVAEIVKETVEVLVTEIVEVVQTSPPIIITATRQPISYEQRALEGVKTNIEWREFAGTQGYSQILNNGFVQTEMLLVPAGQFQMGSSSLDAEPDELPHTQVVDTPFWISKYEVTNEQYAIFLNENGNRSADGFEHLDDDDTDALIVRFNGQWQVKAGFEDHPVIEVTWFGARDYCWWSGQGFRLPTEKEWEYAASGLSNWEYPWGNSWNEDYVVYASNADGQTAPVGNRPLESVSWVGAHDMLGNVWEWTSSMYQDYVYDSSHESDSDTDSGRVFRGGAWINSTQTALRTSNRAWNVPTGSDKSIGFRCAYSE